MTLRSSLRAVALAAGLVLAPAPPLLAQDACLIELEGPTGVFINPGGRPSIYAETDLDLFFAQGYVHAQDRFFQMDLLRRTFSGTLAEAFGPAALGSDIQLRTLGLRRAAERSVAELDPIATGFVQSYADGVNAWLAGNPLPAEYAVLEITEAAPWTVLDSATVAKGIAFGLSFDLSDLQRTEALEAFERIGTDNGFDGQALYAGDLYRSAPFEPTVSIPGTGGKQAPGGTPTIASPRPGTAALARSVIDSFRAIPALARVFDPPGTRGSNFWLVAGEHTDSGAPILATDPHLALDVPANFHEIHLNSRDPAFATPMNVIGASFPGIPGIFQGCNQALCWGTAQLAADVTDVYRETVRIDPGTGLATHTMFDDVAEPLVAIPQEFRFNVIGDTTPNNLMVQDVPAAAGGTTLVVPRRNDGPIVIVDPGVGENSTALSVQYTGWGATGELEGLFALTRAGDLDEFRAALEHFDLGSQAWGVADRTGSIAYFTSGELPIREDLQLLGAPDGASPAFVRDGTGAMAHEWLADPGPGFPFATLPTNELPQSVNPAQGFLAAANNDPLGFTVDNDPFNQLRPGGGIFYFGPGFDPGFRAGQIDRALRELVAGPGPVITDNLEALQGDTRLLDAEVLVPHLVTAFEDATAPSGFEPLAALGADPGVAEAVGRLAAWDFTTPTGIETGFDAGDDPLNLLPPTVPEVDASVAATIYSAWRGQVLQRVLSDPLGAIDSELVDALPGSGQSIVALRNLLDDFDSNQGIGASGIDFFPAAGAPNPEAARDTVLLTALEDALALLASPAFGPAFGQSTDQDDYRWGKLHRIVFDSNLGGPFSVPPRAGFDPSVPGLPGLARQGGLGSIDAAAHNARADGVNEFMFGAGPAWRFFGTVAPDGIEAYGALPGGRGSDPESPGWREGLQEWLVNRYHPLLVDGQAVVDASVGREDLRTCNAFFSDSFDDLTQLPGFDRGAD